MRLEDCPQDEIMGIGDLRIIRNGKVSWYKSDHLTGVSILKFFWLWLRVLGRTAEINSSLYFDSSSNVTKLCVIVNSIKHLWCFLNTPYNRICFVDVKCSINMVN